MELTRGGSGNDYTSQLILGDSTDFIRWFIVSVNTNLVYDDSATADADAQGTQVIAFLVVDSYTV